jgi:DNA-binding transcriptional MerR regulator
MPDNPLLRIGDFSRASSLSVKTLRAYHEAGLLEPAEVDPQTGYRSYSVAQLTDAAIIRRLRQLDLPLEAVRQILDARDPDVTKKILGDHSAVLEERISAMQHAIDELYVALEAPTLHTPVHTRMAPATTILAIGGTVQEMALTPFLERAYVVLTKAATASGAVVTGAFGGCYPTLQEDDAHEVIAFLPVAAAPLLTDKARAAGARVDELPATEVAVLAHHGDYESMDATYRNLGAWVAEHARPGDLAVRELYLVSAAHTDDPADFRTELCWPIRGTKEQA